MEGNESVRETWLEFVKENPVPPIFPPQIQDPNRVYSYQYACCFRVYQVANVKSEWNCIKTFPDLSGTGLSLSQVITCAENVSRNSWCILFNNIVNAGKATSVKFGPDAKYLAVGSMDRNLRIFGLPGDEDPAESWAILYLFLEEKFPSPRPPSLALNHNLIS